MRTALEGKFSTKRDSSLWLSDDPRHVLVRLSADFAVGSIVATLKSYRPGRRSSRRAEARGPTPRVRASSGRADAMC